MLDVGTVRAALSSDELLRLAEVTGRLHLGPASRFEEETSVSETVARTYGQWLVQVLVLLGPDVLTFDGLRHAEQIIAITDEATARRFCGLHPKLQWAAKAARERTSERLNGVVIGDDQLDPPAR